MDKELISGSGAALFENISDIAGAIGNGNPEHVADNGMIILCRQGSAVFNVNFKAWTLPSGGVITLFPGDLVSVSERTDDFSAGMLVFSPGILREASLDIEHSVYDALREDRCRGDSQVVSNVVSCMFSLLSEYFHQPECGCLDKLVLCQLKAFFIGFNDYITRFPEMTPPALGSKRKRSLFNSFMQMLEKDFRKTRDVGWYSSRLSITPKYLNIITRSITGHSVKTLIDHYVILKLKQDLSGTDKPLKQIAWDYNFSDASFFTRYFRQHTGTTPRAWRMSAR